MKPPGQPDVSLKFAGGVRIITNLFLFEIFFIQSFMHILLNVRAIEINFSFSYFLLSNMTGKCHVNLNLHF